MKCQKWITVIVLGILMGMPSTGFTRSRVDSLVLSRIFEYCSSYTPNNVSGHTTNVYVKSNFNVWRRNPTLWLIPTMYSIAEGDRYLVSESYNKLRFNDINNYEKTRKVSYSTIRHNRRALPTVVEFMTPNIYDVCLYDDHSRAIMPKSVVGEPETIVFEGVCLPGVHDADAYLRAVYGSDYMQLPPEEKRHLEHGFTVYEKE